MALGLHDFDTIKSITQAIGRGGHENLDFLGISDKERRSARKSQYGEKYSS
jgi:hypothetical protein